MLRANGQRAAAIDPRTDATSGTVALSTAVAGARNQSQRPGRLVIRFSHVLVEVEGDALTAETAHQNT